MSNEDLSKQLELITEAIIDLSGEVKKLREALGGAVKEQSKAQLRHDTAATRGRRKGNTNDEIYYKTAKELLTAIKESAQTLHEHINNSKRFKSGDFLIQIDYVDKDTFKEIAREAEELGGKYSKKWRGFIFKGEE